MVYSVSTQENTFQFSGKHLEAIDFVALDAQTLHFIHEGKSYLVQLLHIDRVHKKVQVLVNGVEKSIKIEDKLDITIKKMGLETLVASKSGNVSAPMPGLVLDIAVSVGDTIEKGDSVVILEAMKMENVLKAEGMGVVKAINCSKGDKVEKGQLLIEIE